jgi:replicative DNA helicase
MSTGNNQQQSSILDDVVPLSVINQKGLDYIENRRTGKIQSIITPWRSINDVTMGGFEWGTISVVAARSGGGKTTFMLEFTRNVHDLNPNQDFIVLDFQFEMTDEKIALREYSMVTGLSVKELASAKASVDPLVVDQLKKYIANKREYSFSNDKIFVITKRSTVANIRAYILAMYSKYKLPMVITIDHSYLVMMGTEKSELAMLHNLGTMMTELKKAIPCLFIVLNQMNRDIESNERKQPGKAGNYPNTSDIYGGDALYNHADLMLAIDRPYEKNLEIYGPKKYIMQANDVAIHVLKARDGKSDSILFFKGDFAANRFIECPEPDTIPDQSGGGISTKRRVTTF